MIINIVQINDSAYVKHINIYLITCLVGYAFYKPLTAYLNMSESVFKYVRRPLWCLWCSLVVLPLTSIFFTPFFQRGAQVPPVFLALGFLCGEQLHSLTGWCNLFFILMWKTQLFFLDSDRELCCYLERRMSHSRAAVWKCCGHPWQSICQEMLRPSGLFPALKQTGNSLVKQGHQNILILLKSEPKQVGKKCFPISLWIHWLNRLQHGFVMHGIKVCNPGSGCGAVKAETTAAIIKCPWKKQLAFWINFVMWFLY